MNQYFINLFNEILDHDNENEYIFFYAEQNIDELRKLMYEDFKLPGLQPKSNDQLQHEAIRFDDVRKSGPMGNLDKKRTLLTNMKRNAMHGNPYFGGIKNEDMRFRTYTPTVEPVTQAAVIAMRDVSGSMGEFEKYASRTFYAWMVDFLRQKYGENNVEIRFITHHTEAKEVDEQVFFRLGESGGTRVSSAYELALKMMEEKYDPTHWNVYPFHFSDGDNWGDVDNRTCTDLVKKMIDEDRVNAFGYGEIREGAQRSLSALDSAFAPLRGNPKFKEVVIRSKNDVYPALKSFFGPQEVPSLDRR